MAKINTQNNNIERIYTAKLQFWHQPVKELVYSHWRLAAARRLSSSRRQLSWLAGAVHLVLAASRVLHKLLVVLDQFLHRGNLIRKLFVLQVCKGLQIESSF